MILFEILFFLLIGFGLIYLLFFSKKAHKVANKAADRSQNLDDNSSAEALSERVEAVASEKQAITDAVNGRKAALEQEHKTLSKIEVK